MNRVLLAAIGCLFISACATRPPAPPVQHAWALPWGAVDPATKATVGLDDSLLLAGRGGLPPDSDGNGRPNFSVLMISGGGAKGAFGAGVISGWTQSGERPEPSIVTGVSTGALMATWVFLGPKYDRELERFYTTTTDDQIFRKRSLILAPFGDGMLDTTPLKETIASVVDAELLEEVAAEHRRGRRLYVASTDLDNGRLVVWDLSGIAASGRPDRLERYREALRASASIPAGFPPVYFPIDIDGKRYGQMHVDGGAVANFFLSGFVLDRQRMLLPPGTERSDVDVDFYLLINSHLEPQPSTEPIKPNLLSIAMASSWATSWSAQTHQLARSFQAAKSIDAGFFLAGIPETYEGPLPLASFDPEQMAPLFKFAEQHARNGGFWLRVPPGMDQRELQK